MSTLSYVIYCTETINNFKSCRTSNDMEDATDEVVENLKNLYGYTDGQIEISADELGKIVTVTEPK